ncbi:L,D-transpeptidase [Coralloluteibacterium stylophorae]|uniref:L,D-transpeptidase n=1 Tax=Coralloluteibacterium stylophorae TaxID=1776034 RepID=A0A8J8AYJ8_9GAMM|nr:L,D-transpeptidase [Coralloluteibacterium stylophorae]MBS7457411.1 L,D-transpeptidase [Coralloluteibacterium stylophorae]
MIRRVPSSCSARIAGRLLLALGLLAMAGVAPAQSDAIPTGAMPLATPVSALRPGQYVWTPEVAPDGPVLVVVSLPEQLAFVYRNGVRIGTSTVSTGKAGHATPTGVFSILQKRREHYSNLYNNAPMPFMQRLTWDGIALHAGNLPGYPASHGCVRLPIAFAQALFGATKTGMTVVVADDAAVTPRLAHPGLFAPADAAGSVRPDPALATGITWTPEVAGAGPLTIVVSTADARVVVLRDGTVIGNAPVRVDDGPALGTRAYVLMEGPVEGPSRIVPGRDALRWLGVAMPGDVEGAGGGIASDAIARLHADPVFLQNVYDQLVPGTTLVVTDAPARARATGTELTVLRGDALPEDIRPLPTPAGEAVEVRDVVGGG